MRKTKETASDCSDTVSSVREMRVELTWECKDTKCSVNSKLLVILFVDAIDDSFL